MKVIWLKHSDNSGYDITEYISSVTWSGSSSQASRSLNISVLYSPFDDNIKDLSISMGDRIKFYDDEGKLLINAMVYNRERLSEQGTIAYSAYDDLNRLLKSTGTYSFRNTTPEKIVRIICNDLRIEIGDIADTKVPIKKLLVDGENYYNIIMKAYTKAYLALGKKYMPFMYDNKLSIIEKGKIIRDFSLSDIQNITSSNYSETMDNVINKIKIYNEKGEQVGEVKDDKNVRLFGIFQGNYTKEKGVNAVTAAKNMLRGTEKAASIEALGNTACISGCGIKICDTITGLSGNFWIENDSHTWSGGNYTMSLQLAFKNLMEQQGDE